MSVPTIFQNNYNPALHQNCAVCCPDCWPGCPCDPTPAWPNGVPPPLIPFEDYNCRSFAQQENLIPATLETREPCDVCPITPRPFVSKIVKLCDPRVKIRLPLQNTGQVGVTDTITVCREKCCPDKKKKKKHHKKNKCAVQTQGKILFPLSPASNVQHQVNVPAFVPPVQ